MESLVHGLPLEGGNSRAGAGQPDEGLHIYGPGKDLGPFVCPGLIGDFSPHQALLYSKGHIRYPGELCPPHTTP